MITIFPFLRILPLALWMTYLLRTWTSALHIHPHRHCSLVFPCPMPGMLSQLKLTYLMHHIPLSHHHLTLIQSVLDILIRLTLLPAIATKMCQGLHLLHCPNAWSTLIPISVFRPVSSSIFLHPYLSQIIFTP